MSRRRISAVVLSALVVASSLAPPPAAAIIPVTDVAHIAVNQYWHIAHYIQFAETIYREYQQVVNQYEQIKYQLQALKKLENPNWRDVSGLLYTCDWLMRQGESLAYDLANINDQFLTTFPGWQPLAMAWPDQLRLQSTRSLDTFRQSLSVVNEQFNHDIADQIHLQGIEARVNDIHGTQEALETNAVIGSWTAQELALIKQQLAVSNNMTAVYYGYAINQEAQARANFLSLVTSASNSAAPNPQTWQPEPTWWAFGS
jgi:P-type conjugative transfer protein TrbJ